MQTQYRHPILFHTNQNFPLAEIKKPPAKGQPKTKAPIGSTIEKTMKFMHKQREEINLKEKPQKLKFIVNFLFTLHPSPTRFSSELKKINQHQEKKYQPFLQKPLSNEAKRSIWVPRNQRKRRENENKILQGLKVALGPVQRWVSPFLGIQTN